MNTETQDFQSKVNQVAGQISHIAGRMRPTRPRRQVLAQLSPVGREKYENTEGTGLRWNIMEYLARNGASSATELASNMGWSKGKIEMMLDQMEADMLVDKIER